MIAGLPLRHVIAALAALAAIGLARPALSQEQAPEPPPVVSPAQLQLARQVVEIKGIKAMFEPLIRGVVEKTKDTILQSNFVWSKDINEIAANITKEYQPRLSELVDASARYYAGHFTEAELKTILAFYQSPVGQKVLTEEPKAVDESMAYAGLWGDNLSADVLNKMRAEMKKRGHDL
jgi:hypothetical protein